MKNPSRRIAPLWDFLSAKVFCARKMLRIFLIGHKKPSFTAGTLCETPRQTCLDKKCILTIIIKGYIIYHGENMKKILFLIYFSTVLSGLWAQQFTIPAGAELIESTEFKSNGITYIIEQRYRLSSGEILYAYYDVEGSSSVSIQRIEQTPLLALGTNINISGMPGYREFNFGDDVRRLVQFMKLLRLGEPDYRGNVKNPSLSDTIFNRYSTTRREFKLLLDLYDETWVLEQRSWSGSTLVSIDTTRIAHTNRFVN